MQSRAQQIIYKMNFYKNINIKFKINRYKDYLILLYVSKILKLKIINIFIKNYKNIKNKDELNKSIEKNIQ